jgi:hypothetical protein
MYGLATTGFSLKHEKLLRSDNRNSFFISMSISYLSDNDSEIATAKLATML